MKTKKEILKDYERRLYLAKANAYSKESLKRPLTDKETQDYKETMEILKEL